MATISAKDSAGKFQVSLTVTETGTSISDNTSTVSWEFSIKSLGYGGFSQYSIPRTATVNGVNVVNTSSSTGCLNNQTVSWGSGTQTIQHDNDGSKTISISFSAKGLGDYSWSGTISASGTVTLTNIPRASTISVTPTSATITSSNLNSGSLSYTATSKANYYHELTWKIGSGAAQTIWSAQNINNTTRSGTLAYSAIAAQMPSSTGTLTFSLKTYSSSAKTSQIGSTQTTTCQITLQTSSVKPTVVINSITTTASDGPIANYLVAGYSKARISFTVTLPTGASSGTTTFTIKNKTTGTEIGTKTATGTSGTVITDILTSSTSNYTLSVTAVSTDSRGATSSVSAEKTATVYAYAAPVISADFYRVNASGETTSDSGGEWTYARFSASQSYTVGGHNTSTFTISSETGVGKLVAKRNSVALTESPTWNSLAAGSTAKLVITVTDNVTTATLALTVGTSVFALDLYDNGSGSVGVGMGMPGTSGLVRSNMHMLVTNGTYDMRYTSLGLYDTTGTSSTSNNNRILGTVNDHQDILLEAPSRRIMLGYYHTTELGIYVPIMRNVKLNSSVYLTTTDSSNSEHELIGYNGTNLWIGGRSTGSANIVGKTIISSGYDSSTGKGNPSAFITVPKSGNTGSGSYAIYHEGYKPDPEDVGFTVTTTQSGLTAYQGSSDSTGRVTINSGGYYIAGSMVFVQLELKLNRSMAGNDYWTLMTGFPKPARISALAAGVNAAGKIINAMVRTVSGVNQLIIGVGPTALEANDVLAITGVYFKG